METREAFPSNSKQEDEDFIDMKVSSPSSPPSPSSKLLKCNSRNSPPSQSREFEFQMSSSIFSNTTEKDQSETTPSPADELFYNGKLLPLHLPPRLQMLEKILQNTLPNTFDNTENKNAEEESEQQQQQRQCCSSSTTRPSFTAPVTRATNSPLESCNISPSESCRVSCELNPDEYFFQWSTEVSAFLGSNNNIQNQKKYYSIHSWSKKLRQQMRQYSSLSQKLRSSKSYLKSLFTKSACSDESCAKTDCIEQEGGISRCTKEQLCPPSNYKNIKFGGGKKNKPFGQIDNHHHKMVSSFVIRRINDKVMEEEDINDHCFTFASHRRSFSGAIKRHCVGGGSNNKCSSTSCSSSSSSASSSNCSSNSSSFSLKSKGYYELNLLKRSSSANLEVENAIEGAIDHCKKSLQHQQQQQQCFSSSSSTTNKNEKGIFSASRVAARPELSRI